jgi:hypothetical protein
MRWQTSLACFLAGIVLAACASQAAGLTPAQADAHVGQTATICGTVASTHYAEGSDGQPTFVNLDKPYPDPIFTIVIFGDYRAKFSPPPETWSGRLCVTGKITSYRGKPEMKVFDPSQVRH